MSTNAFVRCGTELQKGPGVQILENRYFDHEIVDVIADTMEMTKGCDIKKLGPGTNIKHIKINSGTLDVFKSLTADTLDCNGTAVCNMHGEDDGAVLMKGAHARCEDHDIKTVGGAIAE